jgi:hypothetical protein
MRRHKPMPIVTLIDDSTADRGLSAAAYDAAG